MMNELLDMSDRWNASQPAFKVVKVGLGGSFFCFNNNLDQPIFNKKALSYDKHELAKIISYQQLELLFRPFKNHPSFRDFVRWWWIFIAYGVVFVLLITIMLIVLDPNNSRQNQATFLSFFLVFTIILLLLAVKSEVKRKTAIKGLSEFCKKVNDQQGQFSIKMINSRIVRVDGEYIEIVQEQGLEQLNHPVGYTYFYVSSKRVLQDNRYIKLYKNVGSDMLKCFCDSKDQPIYRDSQFQFESRRLNRLILFEELQLLLRPFKTNYYYQRRLFWNRIAALSIISVILVVIPLELLRDNQVLHQIVSVGFILISQGIFLLGLYKSIKMHAQMLHQLKNYCQDISITNPMIEIILHLRDINSQACTTLLTTFYCLQIRSKGLQTDSTA